MARYAFGGIAYDLIADPQADVLELGDAVVVTFYSTEGGSAVTDFLLWNGTSYATPSTTITTNAAGYLPRFQGPDGVDPLWVQPTTGIWVRLFSWERVAERLTALEAGGASAELIRDTMGTALVGSGVVTVTPNDAGDTITVSSTATANSSDATLLARANHTGEVALNTMASDWSNTAPTNGQAPVYNSTTGLWTPTTPAATTDNALKSGSIQQFADVVDTAPADGDTLEYDGVGTGYRPVDLSTRYAQIDSATGRLVEAAEPLYFLPEIIVNEGDNPPADFPTGGIVWKRPAAPSLIPTKVAGNQAVNSTTVVITTTAALAVNDNIVLVVGASGEATVPATFALTYAAGAGAVTSVAQALQSGTAQCNIFHGKITTLVPSGTALTITSAGNARAQFCADLLVLPNLATTPLDQTTTTTAGTSSNLNLQVGPTSATAQASEVAIGAFVWNSQVSPASRTLAGTNAWLELANHEAETAGAGRALAVFYKILTATGTVAATGTMTASDGSSGAWAGALATFKAV